MSMCAIDHNGNTRDKSGRFYEVIIYIQGGICGVNQWGDKYTNWGKIEEKVRKN